MILINDLEVENIEMHDLKLVSDYHDGTRRMLLPPSSSAEGKMVCHRCTEMGETRLGVLHRKEMDACYNRLSSIIFRQDETEFGRRGYIFHRLGLTISNISTPEHSEPFLPDEIVIVPIRELSYNDAKKEISEYIKKAGDRKVYISELAEELVIDFELIEEIIEELEMHKRNLF